MMKGEERRETTGQVPDSLKEMLTGVNKTGLSLTFPLDLITVLLWVFQAGSWNFPRFLAPLELSMGMNEN